MQENYKILVVDDDMRLRALLERYLTEQGFQVRSVANAEQMDRLLTRESFHLMVLDLMLPGEDGFPSVVVCVARATLCRSSW